MFTYVPYRASPCTTSTRLQPLKYTSQAEVLTRADRRKVEGCTGIFDAVKSVLCGAALRTTRSEGLSGKHVCALRSRRKRSVIRTRARTVVPQKAERTAALYAGTRWIDLALAFAKTAIGVCQIAKRPVNAERGKVRRTAVRGFAGPPRCRTCAVSLLTFQIAVRIADGT